MYKHTQFAWWIFVPVVALCAVIFGLVPHRAPEPYIAAIVLLIFLAIFGSLTVSAAADKLSLHFGIGLIRKSFPYDNIQSIERVRNRWYWGWGVRWFGRGWLFNVAGLDAVELKLKNGRIFRIGTDEPETLLRYVRNRMGQ